jgi:hypothetical protein
LVGPGQGLANLMGWLVGCRSRDVDSFAKAGVDVAASAGIALCGTAGGFGFGWMAADSILAFRWP